ncbi:glutaredoxin-C9 [Cajanus cajan]|uniref:Glutaredoxin-C9 n=1 Tax=Cajanus cajan TaxID=3821 RepID=A0A151SVH3_CAJCA|nr:glutaredoxin-C9 [Cajanus cajan]KYP58786.1 Glutaredoxin-C9 [Cajanus cajan]
MQQAIPYGSWQPLITPHPTTHHFTITPHSLTTTHIHNTFNTHNSTNSANNSNKNDDNRSNKNMVLKLNNMVLENAVIVFARRGCCMSHVVKRLLLGLGVNPAMHEIEERDEVGVVRELEEIVGANNGKLQFPAVFIGGKLFGGLDRVMATHISGELVPVLKEAGALWL